MFTISNNGKITITKGDTAVITVDLENADGTPYEMQDGDTLTMTVRRAPGSPVLFSVESQTNVIGISASASKKLIVGSCVYDIELKTADGKVDTVLGPRSNNSPANMVVLPDVTE